MDGGEEYLWIDWKGIEVWGLWRGLGWKMKGREVRKCGGFGYCGSEKI